MLDSVLELESGERVALAAMEIVTIPDVSIIEGKGDHAGDGQPKDYVVQYKKDFARFVTEIFQHCKSGNVAQNHLRDVSLEILWLTRPAANQAYRAGIRLLVVLRTIDADTRTVNAALEEFRNLSANMLSTQKYEFKNLDFQMLRQAVAEVEYGEMRALVKEDRIDILQNQMLNECFVYDRFAETSQDLSKIANILVEHPHCSLSFQLIPVALAPYETDALDRMTNLLETLTRGVHDQTIGTVGFALAEKPAETYRYYSQRKNSGLFLFNILVSGPASSVGQIATRVCGQLGEGAGPATGIRQVSLPADEVDVAENLHALPWLLSERLLTWERNPAIWREGGGAFGAFHRLPYIVTAEEAAEFFRLPVGSHRVAAGFAVNAASKTSRSFSGSIINGGDIQVGQLKSSADNNTIGFFLSDLTKHMLVVGTPGSGKTTFSVSLLDRLWKEFHIPFLVIEPAKNEYRALVQSIPDLQVFTPGKNFISPFMFNPFVPPRNVRLETYKSVLKTAFAAAVTMTTPLDKIFEETVHNCYSDFRWLDSYTSESKGRHFNIQDFIQCFQRTFDAIGYTGDAKNIGRAGLVRLAGLANLFDNYGSIPIEDILSRPTVIELAAIENSDEKALLIALLLLSILSYVNRNYLGLGKLRNVILLEEAHVLLDSESKGSEGAADPGTIAKGLVKRMLAEIRSYGVGLVIADQSPRKVGTDVVALTNIKLSFRLVEREDKEIVANSTNMSDVHVQRLARLKPGEAMLFFDKLEEPEEVKTADYRMDNNISISLTDESIAEQSTYWRERLEKLRPYPECAEVRYCARTCDFARRGLAKEISRRIFKRNFKAETDDAQCLRAVYAKIEHLTAAELNDELFSKELAACVKLQFLRRVKYGTRITVSDTLMRNTLEKV